MFTTHSVLVGSPYHIISYHQVYLMEICPIFFLHEHFLKSGYPQIIHVNIGLLTISCNPICPLRRLIKPCPVRSMRSTGNQWSLHCRCGYPMDNSRWIILLKWMSWGYPPNGNLGRENDDKPWKFGTLVRDKPRVAEIKQLELLNAHDVHDNNYLTTLKEVMVNWLWDCYPKRLDSFTNMTLHDK